MSSVRVKVASGSNAIKLACLPGSIEPMCVERPASSAGAAEVQRVSWERVSSRRVHSVPEDGEGGGEAGDAAPGEVEAAGALMFVLAIFQSFHVRWAGRVVGGDEVDGAVDEGLP